MHTLTELCIDLSIGKGSRTRAVRRFQRDYNITGKRMAVGAKNHLQIVYTDEEGTFQVQIVDSEGEIIESLGGGGGGIGGSGRRRLARLSSGA